MNGTQTAQDWTLILEALRAISARCDGAESEDQAGFNKPDSYRCKYWATLDTLTPGQAFEAHWRLRKYAGQLAKLGIDFNAIPEPANASLRASDLMQPVARRDHTRDSDTRIIRTDGTNAAFTLAWPYRDVAKILTPMKEHFPQRSYSREPFPHWRVPANAQAAQLMDFAIANEFQISEEACALFDKIIIEVPAIETASTNGADSPAQHRDRMVTQGTMAKNGELAFILFFNFDRDIYDAVKGIAGARYMPPPERAWAVPIAAAPVVAAIAERFHFNVDAETKAVLIAELEKSNKAASLDKRRRSALIEAAKDIPNGVFGSKTPRPYQIEGVSFMLNAIGRYSPTSGVILADHVGLGKTFEAMLIARCFQRAYSAHVFVVCPVSLQSDWMKEARACNVKAEVFSWAKIPKPVSAPYIVIADECHYMQDSKTIRSKAMMNLVKGPSCLTFIAASATPMRGMRPKNIFPVLRAVGHPVAQNQKSYEERYCNRTLRTLKGHSFWDVNGSAHLQELMREIGPIFLQRLKKDVLKDLPPLTIISREVEIGPDSKAMYDKVFKEAQARYQARRIATEQKIKEATAKGIKPDQIEFTKDDAREGAEAVVLLGHLRRAASMAMIQPTIDFADDILDQGEKVMIYSEYPEVCNRIVKHYSGIGIGAEALTGEVKPEERDKAKERFQFGNSRVFCITKAGGVGLTLTAASNGILVDQPWMWDDIVQVTGRLHRQDEIMERRIKETENPAVMAYLLKGFEVNEKIQARLFEQREITEKFEGGGRASMRNVKSIHDLAKEVAAEMFGK